MNERQRNSTPAPSAGATGHAGQAGRQESGVRDRGAEVRGPRSEVRGQKTGVRDQRTEVGGRKGEKVRGLEGQRVSEEKVG